LVSKKRNIHKIPKYKKSPPKDKKPRAIKLGNINKQTIAWQFSKLDMGGKWCCKKIDVKTLWGFLYKKIKAFESMTWSEIYQDKDKNHDVKKEDLSKDAQKRLIKIRQDDVDLLFTLHLSGMRRIWGIRDGRALKILWYDPEHEVCISSKRHT